MRSNSTEIGQTTENFTDPVFSLACGSPTRPDRQYDRTGLPFGHFRHLRSKYVAKAQCSAAEVVIFYANRVVSVAVNLYTEAVHG